MAQPSPLAQFRDTFFEVTLDGRQGNRRMQIEDVSTTSRRVFMLTILKRNRNKPGAIVRWFCDDKSLQNTVSFSTSIEWVASTGSLTMTGKARVSIRNTGLYRCVSLLL
jgi:hypothetical protein